MRLYLTGFVLIAVLVFFVIYAVIIPSLLADVIESLAKVSSALDAQ